MRKRTSPVTISGFQIPNYPAHKVFLFMSNQNLMLVSFNRDQLQMVDFEGQPYVVMKPIVKSLKMSWGSQHTKLLENKQKFSYTAIGTTGIDGKTYEMGCIPLKKLNGWLFGINAKNIPNLNTRSKVEKYQEECFEVLWNYWSNRSKSPYDLLLEEKWNLEHEPVRLLSFEQQSYNDRIAHRKFTWTQFQEFFGMKEDQYFMRVIIGKINRQVLGMSAGQFRRMILGPQQVRMVNGQRIRLDVETNNKPKNLTKDFLPKPHQECIYLIMSDLLRYFQARPNWTHQDVRTKLQEFITTETVYVENLVSANLHQLIQDTIRLVHEYVALHEEVSPYEVIDKNLITLNYDILALEREVRKPLIFKV